MLFVEQKVTGQLNATKKRFYNIETGMRWVLRGGMPMMGSPTILKVPFSKVRIALTHASLVE